MEIGVVGSGFVGLVTGACLADIGHHVRCVDTDPRRVALVREGKAPFFEAGLEPILTSVIADGRFGIDTDLETLSGCEVIFLTVGTPTVDGAIDLSQVLGAARRLGAMLSKGVGYPVVVVKSTVVPGTTWGPVREALEQSSGLIAGRDFGLAMNPEFLREGEAVADFADPDRIVLGSEDPRALKILRAVYAPYGCPVLEMAPVNAEMCKYANNTLLATLISFANDLATLCEGMEGADIREVNRAMFLDRRLAPVVDGRRIEPGILTYLRSGIGFGGSCFPKDVAALAHLARDRGYPSAMLDATLAVNERRPHAVVRLADTLAGGLKGRRVALLGLAFKAGTDDTRESVSLVIAEELLKQGAEIVAYDPLVSEVPVPLRDNLSLAADLAEAMTGADLAILATAWPEFALAPWESLTACMAHPLLIDGRGQLRGRVFPPNVHYVPVGVGPRPVSNDATE